MNLNQLKYALAVARERNFSRAARICNVSQPSLSVAIKSLEEELGLPLFERSKSEIKITNHGKQVLEQMQKVMEEMAHIQTVAQRGTDPLAGQLRIGAIFTIGPYLFPGTIPAFHTKAPRMKLLVEENYTNILSDRLKQGELDVIIIALPFQEHGVEVLPLYDEPFVAAVPAGHRWHDRTDLSGIELADDDLIVLGKGNCFRDHVLEICPDCMRVTDTASGPGNIIEGSSLETIRHMVATGAGITVLPITSVHTLLCTTPVCPAKENQLVRYVPFTDPVPSRRVALAWRSSFPNQRIIAILADSIRAHPPIGVHMIPIHPV
ncbi:MAG: LysR family transcriptional regulator [Nitrospirae bacterium]|nr:LysR family transcriptional regulator [Magnetococcales bacterium]HAT51055.1 LysR family transcriptional regulator [Alphaproteobacteria bacterium]